MTKSASANLNTHAQQDVTTLATCWRVERTDGVTLAFTDHDRDIVYDSITYLSDTGFSKTDLKHDSDLSVSTMDIQGVLNSPEITEADLRAQRYYGAVIYVFIINWADTSQGIIKLQKGWLGEVVPQDGIYVAELRGLADAYKNNILEIVSPECQADFGDTRCGFDIATVTFSGSVNTVTDRRQFTTSGITHSSDNQYQAGKVTFTSGLNNGITYEVKSSTASNGEIKLYLKATFTIAPGDTLDVAQGCLKTKQNCKDYNNFPRFRGFPFVIGVDRLMQYPDSFS